LIQMRYTGTGRASGTQNLSRDKALVPQPELWFGLVATRRHCGI